MWKTLILFYHPVFCIRNAFFSLSSHFTETLRLNSEKREKQTASKLTETREYFHSIISQTADAILVQSKNGDVMTVNRAFLELYGWNEKEMRNIPFQHIPATQKTVFNEVLSKIVNGEAVSGYEMVNQKNQASCSLFQSPFPLFGMWMAQSGPLQGYTGTLRKQKGQKN